MIFYRLDSNFKIVGSQTDGKLKKGTYYMTPISFGSLGKNYGIVNFKFTFDRTGAYNPSYAPCYFDRHGAKYSSLTVGSIVDVDYHNIVYRPNIASDNTLTATSENLLPSSNAIVFQLGPYSNYGDFTVNTLQTGVQSYSPPFAITSSLNDVAVAYDEAKEFTVSAKYDEYMFTQYKVGSGTFYYRVAGTSSYTSLAFTGAKVTVPANTFTTGNTYECYIKANEATTGATAQTKVATITEVVQTPHVKALSPSGTVEHGQVTFEWSYSIGTNTPQKKFTIQTSNDGSSWTTLKTSTSSATKYTAQISESGNKYWRVRATSQKDVNSAYSEALFFINRVKPATPNSVAVSGTGRPTVTWNATDQIAYEVEFGQYKSGIVYSSATSHYFNEYIPNETYNVKVRVYNAYGDASDWAVIEYTQDIAATVPEASIEQVNDGVMITVSNYDQFNKVYILRDNELVAKMNGGSYIDYYLNGNTVYTVRGVQSDDTFADYEIMFNYVCRVSKLLTMNGETIDLSKRLDNHPSVSASHSLRYQELQFLGRDKPVHINDEMSVRRWSVICNNNDIVNHLGELLFYRNYAGEKAFVKVYSVNLSHQYYGSEVSVTLQETDEKAVLNYD